MSKGLEALNEMSEAEQYQVIKTVFIRDKGTFQVHDQYLAGVYVGSGLEILDSPVQQGFTPTDLEYEEENQD